jgi:hypothetical protein
MESLSGCAPSGESINPEELPEEPVDSSAEPRAVPSPGLPVSEEEYKRMKEAAKHAPAPRVKNAQEDRSKK